MDELDTAREDLQDYILLVTRESSQTFEIREGLLGMREVLHSCRKSHQTVLAQQGMIEWLVQFVQSEKSSLVAFLAFGVLGDMCLFNEEVSGRVGKNEILRELVERLLQDVMCPSTTKQMALRSLNIAADSWETHVHLVSLIPKLVGLLTTSSDSNLMRIAVMFLGKFAYNEHMHHDLVTAQAVPPLYAVSQSTNQHLLPVAASLAVVNLTRGSLTIAPESVQEVVDAFGTTLNQMPYPPGSRYFGTPWKIAMGLANMCLNRENALQCYEAGCLSLVEDALRNTQDSRLIEYGLLVLWRVNAHLNSSVA